MCPFYVNLNNYHEIGHVGKLGIKYVFINVPEKPKYLEKYIISTALGLAINEKLEFTGISKYDKLEMKI